LDEWWEFTALREIRPKIKSASYIPAPSFFAESPKAILREKKAAQGCKDPALLEGTLLEAIRA
jgi:hypothetical protein